MEPVTAASPERDRAGASLPVPTVRVRYWAAARAAAGRAEDTVEGRTLADVLAAVRALHRDRPRLAEILATSSLLVGDVPVGSRDPATVRLRPADVIEVLPPFAGG